MRMERYNYIDRIISENINDFINENILSEAEVHKPLQPIIGDKEGVNFSTPQPEVTNTQNVQQITNDNSSNGEGTTPQTVQPETTTPNVELWQFTSALNYKGYIEKRQTVDVNFIQNKGFFITSSQTKVNIVNFSKGNGEILILGYNDVGINSQNQFIRFAYDTNQRDYYNAQNPKERYSEVVFYMNNNQQGKMENETPEGDEQTVEDDDNVRQSGLEQGGEGTTEQEGQGKQNPLLSLINPNENYPISNALIRLSRKGYIDNQSANLLIRDLKQIGF